MLRENSSEEAFQWEVTTGTYAATWAPPERWQGIDLTAVFAIEFFYSATQLQSTRRFSFVRRYGE